MLGLRMQDLRGDRSLQYAYEGLQVKVSGSEMQETLISRGSWAALEGPWRWKGACSWRIKQ